MNLDQQDLEILKILQLELRTNIETLSESVGLSTASIQRRLKRLRDNHIIASEVAIIDPTKVEQPMTFIISIELERDNVASLLKFKKKIKQEPMIQQCYYVTGESDFILIICTKDMQSFDAFTQKLFFDESNVRRYTTTVVMERTKVSLQLAL